MRRAQSRYEYNLILGPVGTILVYDRCVGKSAGGDPQSTRNLKRPSAFEQINVTPLDESLIANFTGARFDAAVANHQRALEIRPNYAEAHNSLGVAYYPQGKSDAAVACYCQALQINPDFAEAQFNWVLVWLIQGNSKRGGRATNGDGNAE